MFFTEKFLSDLHSFRGAGLVHSVDSFSGNKWYSVLLDNTTLRKKRRNHMGNVAKLEREEAERKQLNKGKSHSSDLEI